MSSWLASPSSHPSNAGDNVLDPGVERVLLINPAVYDTRFPWARWTQPTLLLRTASFYRSHGVDVKLIDALHRQSTERLRKKLIGRVEIDGVNVNRWRFGLPSSELRAQMNSLAKANWLPDKVYIEGLTTIWWQGVQEVIALSRKTFPTSEVLLLGAYPALAPQHASENAGAHRVVLGLPTELSHFGTDLSVYERPPGFTYVWLGAGVRDATEVVHEIAAKTAGRAVRHLAFGDERLAHDGATASHFRAVLEGLCTAGSKTRLYAIGNISPANLVAHPDLAGLMKRAGYGELYFADDRFAPLDQATENRLVDDYSEAAELLHEAGFAARRMELSGGVSVGRPGEDLVGRARLATRVAHAIGSLVLWPYQPTPAECADLPLEEQNGKLFPFRHSNGATYRDYLDLLGLAAVLNAKYRQRTFDFLGDGLIPRLVRHSLRGRAWEPPEDVKGSLRVATAEAKHATLSVSERRSVVLSTRNGRGHAQLVTDATFPIPTGRLGFRRALLLNPPVYDAQYWARWSQPAGLLRIATYLRQCGYELNLIDCMEADAKGYVPKTRRLVGGRPHVVQRDDVQKPIYHFGMPWEAFDRRLRQMEPPDQVWISSIMTYWWESTRDAIQRVRAIFPHAEIIVGGIYPTLAPEHAVANLGADVVLMGEIGAASTLPTDLGLYRTPPTYAILTTSRGCPWECHYCSARTLNGGSNKMRAREPQDVVDEIEYKLQTFGIRRFGFYEDNALALRGHLQRVLELIIERGLKLELYAPEGFETRLLTADLLRTMKQAGFKKIHLPFEALRWETNIGWNRRHASTASFERALSLTIEAGFRPRTEEINAFVLFGLPDDALEQILDGVLYVHHMVGSTIPMLFTPVPGTQIFREHEQYLLHSNQSGRQWDLQDLNGKLLPFLEYNRQRYPGLRASDYLVLEGLMSILNSGKVFRRSVDLCDETSSSRAFRSVAAELVDRADHIMRNAR